MSLETEYRQKQEELAVKRTRLAGLFKQADTETDATKRAALSDDITASNKELADLVDAIVPLQDQINIKRQNDDAIKAMRTPGAPQINDDQKADLVDRESSYSDDIVSKGAKSLSSAIRQTLEARGIKSLHGFRGALPELAIKALLTSADMTPLEDRQSRLVLSAQEERTVADLMLQGTTTAQKVTYFEETTFTNNADVVAEGEAKPEVVLDFTLREDNVRKIAAWVPVTDEMMDDVPGFEAYLRGRLPFMVKRKEEQQLLTGSGVGQNILGVYNRTGVQTVTGYGMSTIDSILAAITEVQTDAFAEPTAMVIHPRDWFNVRTSKDSMGNYLLGPATLDPNAVRPWGLAIRVTTAATENTALVGDFNQAQVFRRSGITVDISTEHSDYFIYNKLAVRAEERLALAVYRPSAFCKVEAIVTGS